MDVTTGDWFYNDIRYVVEKGFMQGIGEDDFGVDDEVTRAMFVTVIYRMENEPQTDCDMTFKDVLSDTYYANAVAWATANGIVAGYSDEEFGPDDTITREQMAAIMYRYAEYKGHDMTVTEPLIYTDAESISDYALTAVMWATGNGILSGYTDNTMRPDATAIRAQIAAVCRRFDERLNLE